MGKFFKKSNILGTRKFDSVDTLLSLLHVF